MTDDNIRELTGSVIQSSPRAGEAVAETCRDCGYREPCDDDCPNDPAWHSRPVGRAALERELKDNAVYVQAIRRNVIEECARSLETSYPDHAWLNAACAAIRSLAHPLPAPGWEALEKAAQIAEQWILPEDDEPKWEVVKERRDRQNKVAREIADAIRALSPSSTAGGCFIPIDIVRNCHCPSDGLESVAHCIDSGNCGCSVGLLCRRPADSEAGK